MSVAGREPLAHSSGALQCQHGKLSDICWERQKVCLLWGVLRREFWSKMCFPRHQNRAALHISPLPQSLQGFSFTLQLSHQLSLPSENKEVVPGTHRCHGLGMVFSSSVPPLNPGPLLAPVGSTEGKGLGWDKNNALGTPMRRKWTVTILITEGAPSSLETTVSPFLLPWQLMRWYQKMRSRPHPHSQVSSWLLQKKLALYWLKPGQQETIFFF